VFFYEQYRLIDGELIAPARTYWYDNIAADYSVPKDESGKILTITNEAELALFIDELWDEGQDYYEGWTVNLTADLDLGAHYWHPAHVQEVNFNGNGKTIRGLKVIEAEYGPTWWDAYAGLFGMLDRSIVRDLKFENPVINIANYSWEYFDIYMGVVAGSSIGSKIREVYIVNPTVTVGRVVQTAFMGGVIGNVEASTEPNLDGGLMSVINGAEITGGQIVITEGFTNSYGYRSWLTPEWGGDIAYMGGIAGANYNSVILNTAVYGTKIEANDDYDINIWRFNAGGIAGYTSSINPPEPGTCIFNSVSSATFKTTGFTTEEGMFIGGIAGWVNEDAVVNTVYIGEEEIFGELEEGGFTVSHNHAYATVADANADNVIAKLNDETPTTGGFWTAVQELFAHADHIVDLEAAKARFKTWAPRTVGTDVYMPGFGPIIIIIAPSITTAAAMPAGVFGVAYNQTLAADGSAAQWSITTGALPAGLTLNASTGVISGTPTAAGPSTFTVKAENFTGSDTKELSIVINKANPVVTWPADVTATFGQTLANVTITGGTGAGTFTWTTPSTAVGEAGNRDHNMTFTPTDTENFNTLTQDVAVTVGTVSILSSDRAIPTPNSPRPEGGVVSLLSGEFTAGPNPAAKSAGVVNFFWQGKRIESASLTIFDASGNVVNRIAVSDRIAISDRRDAMHCVSTMAGSTDSRRIIGSWDLTDARGRLVAEGTYLVRGTITIDGKKERVSVMMGVR
jgi:hypothetical protein